MAGVRVKLKNVRLSFPQLFAPKAIEEGQEPKYSASFLFETGGEVHKLVLQSMLAAAKSKWEEKGEAIFKQLMEQDRQICLHKGDLKEYDGYAGMMYVTAKNKTKPGIFEANKSPILDESVGRPYAGCYVNAIVEFYAQSHPTGGKRINASLAVVQFLRDGDAFTGGRPGTADELEDESGEIADIGVADTGENDALAEFMGG